MQIFTTELLIQAYVQSREIARAIFGALIETIWSNMAVFFPALFEAIAAGDWDETTLRILVLVGGMIVLFRLIRKIPLKIFNSINEM